MGNRGAITWRSCSYKPLCMDDKNVSCEKLYFMFKCYLYCILLDTYPNTRLMNGQIVWYHSISVYNWHSIYVIYEIIKHLGNEHFAYIYYSSKHIKTWIFHAFGLQHIAAYISSTSIYSIFIFNFFCIVNLPKCTLNGKNLFSLNIINVSKLNTYLIFLSFQISCTTAC